MNDEVKLILTKLKIVSEEKENGCYICDREHSKLLLSYIEQLEKENETLREIVNIKDEQLKEIQMQKTDYTAVNILEAKIKQLENNRDKAIEILSGSYCTYDDVIKILKGDSDE